jgi:hypothetical protein
MGEEEGDEQAAITMANFLPSAGISIKKEPKIVAVICETKAVSVTEEREKKAMMKEGRRREC